MDAENGSTRFIGGATIMVAAIACILLVTSFLPGSLALWLSPNEVTVALEPDENVTATVRLPSTEGDVQVQFSTARVSVSSLNRDELKAEVDGSVMTVTISYCHRGCRLFLDLAESDSTDETLNEIRVAYLAGDSEYLDDIFLEYGS